MRGLFRMAIAASITLIVGGFILSRTPLAPFIGLQRNQGFL